MIIRHYTNLNIVSRFSYCMVLYPCGLLKCEYHLQRIFILSVIDYCILLALKRNKLLLLLLLLLLRVMKLT